jgi:hypothetical protein
VKNNRGRDGWGQDNIDTKWGHNMKPKLEVSVLGKETRHALHVLKWHKQEIPPTREGGGGKRRKTGHP